MTAEFDAVAMVGYHAAASVASNPLSHTLAGRFAKILLNGELMAEFHMHSYIARTLDVPVVMISGDGGICQAARQFNPAIQTVETGLGSGASNTGLHPAKARSSITEGITKALGGDLAQCRIELPPSFEIRITFKNHAGAYRAGFYPGARAVDGESVALEADNFFDIARFLNFV